MRRRRKIVKEKMSGKTNIDALITAEELTKPFEKDLEKAKTRFWSHAAIIISLLSIYLMTLLYAYDQGFFAVYKIQVSHTDIDIRRFLPLLIRMIGVYACIGFYLGSMKYNQIRKKASFTWLRILWGANIMIAIFSHYIKGPICIVISIAFPLIVELIILLGHKLRIKEEELSHTEYEKRVEDYAADQFLFYIYKKPLVVLILLSVIVAPFWGSYVARNKTQYETLNIDGCEYVIVSTDGDNAYIEAVDITDGYAIIHTNEYMRITIYNHKIKTIEFDKVKIE